LRGSGRVIADAKAFSLSPGRCVLIAPFQFHHYTAVSRSDIDWLFVTFVYGNSPLAGAATGVFSVGASFWADLAELIRNFRAAGPKNADRLAWRLALILDSLSATPASPTKPTAPVAQEELLLRVSTIASTHIHDPLSVPQLAQKLGLSSSHLRQKFHQVAGISLGRFLREFRLRYAAELLATGQANVTEASAACGWDTPYAFSRAFRKYWGRPPKLFAMAHQQKP
jgi:AraC-like DNA-binding protein